MAFDFSVKPDQTINPTILVPASVHTIPAVQFAITCTSGKFLIEVGNLDPKTEVEFGNTIIATYTGDGTISAYAAPGQTEKATGIFEKI